VYWQSLQSYRGREREDKTDARAKKIEEHYYELREIHQ
jgi:hypothetical protein